MAPAATADQWSSDFDTVRREKLFRQTPKDHSAYPLLAAAVEPHVQSFNAVFEDGGRIEDAIKDIGTKTFLDGTPSDPQRNALHARITNVWLEKTQLPATNKYVTDPARRQIYPAECRERHVTYRGRLRARLEWWVNDEPKHELVRELGQVPLMLRVSRMAKRDISSADKHCSRTGATSKV